MEDTVAREIIASLTNQVHDLMDQREASAWRLSAVAEIANRDTWGEVSPLGIRDELLAVLVARA